MKTAPREDNLGIKVPTAFPMTRGNSFSIVNRLRLDDRSSIPGRSRPCAETGSGTYPVSYPPDTGVFPRDKAAGA
jgi:hypothetical protein